MCGKANSAGILKIKILPGRAIWFVIMLHELLLSLVGYSGNVIVETREGFHLAPDFPHLHPSERELIDKICCLGYYFLQIDSYVQKHSQFSPVEGFYVRAMCEAINLTLDNYRACVLKAEQTVLSYPDTSLSHLLHILYEVCLTFCSFLPSFSIIPSIIPSPFPPFPQNKSLT
jgi:hypothetical protein